ncbi:MAG TPA: DUF4129 domain-containing protein [Acidimicrobiales bacterium]|nr:DUF4129 domain-containing protein [Acidimicrobiales bacterium]
MSSQGGNRPEFPLFGPPVGKLRLVRGSMEAVTRSRAIVTAALAVALLFVVAAAAGVAGGRQATSTAGSSSASAPGGLGGPTWSGSLVVALVSAAGIWVIYSLLPGLFRRRRRRPLMKRPWWYWPAVVAVAVGVSTAFFAGLSWLLRGKVPRLAQNGSGRQLQLGAFPRLPASGAAASGGGGGGVSWEAIAAGALLAILAIIASYLWRRRRWGTGPVTGGLPRRALDEQRRQVVEVLDESLEALEAEPDPRKAVIAAYVRMDQWLARAGFGRRSSEAPFEHLDRIVDGLGATTAVGGTLAGLYERAKFDYRPCGPEMKQAAIAALVQLRDELASLQTEHAHTGGGTTGKAPDDLSARAGSRSGPSTRPAGGAGSQVGLT